jgi:hypothetical protein
MVTRRRAFEGTSQLSVFTAILEKEPEPITTSQPLAPPTLDRVVRACLAKDPADRLQSAHDVAMGLRWMADSTPTESTKISPQFNKSWTAVLAALLLAFVALWRIRRVLMGKVLRGGGLDPCRNPPDKFSMDTTGGPGGMPVLSPQGDKIAFLLIPVKPSCCGCARSAVKRRKHCILSGRRMAATSASLLAVS